MTVKESYLEAIQYQYYSLQLLIEFLVYEKKVLKFTDHEDKLKYFLQDRFAAKMNVYLADYELKKEQKSGGLINANKY
jgi:hypothetical protein